VELSGFLLSKSFLSLTSAGLEGEGPVHMQTLTAINYAVLFLLIGGILVGVGFFYVDRTRRRQQPPSSPQPPPVVLQRPPPRRLEEQEEEEDDDEYPRMDPKCGASTCA